MAIEAREDKVAVLLAALGPETAGPVLARLAPEHRELMRARMQELSHSPPPAEDVELVLQEFDRLLADPQWFLQLVGESETGTSGADGSNGHERLDDVEGEAAEADPMTMLQQLAADRLALALQDEHPRTAAVVLGRLPGERAGAVLARLPEQQRRQVFAWLGKGQATAELEPLIVEAVVRKGRQLSERDIARPDEERFKRMADILRAMEKETRADLLAAMEEADAETAARIKELIYRFSDLSQLSDRSVQKILAEIDTGTLATALFEAPETIAQKVFANLSKRAGETLNEELSFRTSVPTAEVEQARKKVVEAMQLLDQSGDLVMEQ